LNTPVSRNASRRIAISHTPIAHDIQDSQCRPAAGRFTVFTERAHGIPL
jgi:hypothetical protein